MSYKTFIRSYVPASREPHGLKNNFLSGRKITQDTGLSYNEAHDACDRYNKNRNARQIRKGTMMEFTEE